MGEVLLVPDLATFWVLPFAPRSGAVLCDHHRLERPVGRRCAGGSFLKRMVAGLAKRERVLHVAFENEIHARARVDDRYERLDVSAS